MTTATTHSPIADANERTAARRASVAAQAKRAGFAVLKPLASLKLTVALFALSIALIFAATLAQVDQGIWLVMEQYFKTPIAWVPLDLFVGGDGRVGRAFPMPGGVVLGAALLVNLLAAHALRFKLKARGWRLWLGLPAFAVACGIVYVFHYVAAPHELLVNNGLPVLFSLGTLVYAPLIAASALLFGKRLGIVLIHASLILLLVGEGVSAYARGEAQLVLREGETASWAHDIRESELAIIWPHDNPGEPASAGGNISQSPPGEPASPDGDISQSPPGEPASAGGPSTQREKVLAIPESMLAATARGGGTIRHPDLPFDLVVEKYVQNAVFYELPQDGTIRPAATAGVGLEAGMRPQPPASGVGDQRVNMPGVQISFVQNGRTLGRYVFSSALQRDDYVFLRQDVPLVPGVEVGRTGRIDPAIADEVEHVEVVMRWRREYLPASFTLLEFRHDVYPGTQVPKNFSSDLRIVRPETNEDRVTHIYMNHPLRYADRTFFQAGYLPDNAGTILQVVDNPAAQLPYIACIAGGMGLTIHFVLSLGKFLGKRRKEVARG
ncbi:MAG: cytochrome c biogenesis protein ResB [Phycisphaeraceae bacterium]